MMNQLFVDVQPSTSISEGTDLSKSKDRFLVVDSTEIIFPDFQNLKRLGRGAYGTVLQCFFRGNMAAAKLVETNVDYCQIRAEARLLHEFRHPNIVTLYAVFQGQQNGLLLEIMEGGSLMELLHQNKHIKYRACHVLHWFQQIVSAIGFLHMRGYIHRDIKPSNMLLSRDFLKLKLCDFGTAAELHTSMTNSRGTAAWMAPEVFKGKKYDQRCDIFSLGILFWEIVARKRPFQSLDINPYRLLWKVAEGIRPASIKNCPQQLMDLIQRCWANDPDDRPLIDEITKIIDALCEIFTNTGTLSPLLDQTTGLPACDHQYNYAAQSYNEPCDSAYQLQPIYRSYSNDSDTSTRLNNHYIPNEQNSVTYNVFTPKPNACNYNPCLTPVSPAITNSGYIQNNAIDAKCEPPSNKRVVHYFEHLICSHVSIFL